MSFIASPISYHYRFSQLLNRGSTTSVTVISPPNQPPPPHSVSLSRRYGIQAVTLRALNDASVPGPRSGLPHLARLLEGVFRSLNNLLERFHQSFFFYLMPATSRYISIGEALRR